MLLTRKKFKEIIQKMDSEKRDGVYIAKFLNKQGYRTPTGIEWNHHSLSYWRGQYNVRKHPKKGRRYSAKKPVTPTVKISKDQVYTDIMDIVTSNVRDDLKVVAIQALVK